MNTEIPYKTSIKNTLRIILPSTLTLMLFAYALFFIAVPTLERELEEANIDKTKQLVNSALTIMSYYHEQVDSNELTIEQAKERVIKRLKRMRYGDDGLDYFWINDTNYIMIMHPFRNELEGQNLYNFTDPEGTYIFRNIVKIAKTQVEGSTHYMWQWKNDTTVIAKKVSYVKLFKPWGWVIGTGTYRDELNESINRVSNKLLIYSIIIFFIIVIISVYIIWRADNNEKKKAHIISELRQSEEKFRAFAEQSVMGILIIKEDRYIFANEASSNIFGYSVEELKAFPPVENYSKIIHPDYLDFVIDQAQKKQNGITEDLVHFYTCKAIRKDKKVVWIENFAKTIKFGDEYADLVMFWDVTERKISEEKINELNENLEQLVQDRTASLSDAMEELKIKNEALNLTKEELEYSLEKEKELGLLKSRFVSMVSHEYRTPLTVILTSAYLIERMINSGNGPGSIKHIERIKNSVNTMTELIEDILTIGRNEEENIRLNKVEIDIIDYIKSYLHELTTLNESYKQIKFIHSVEIAYIRTDIKYFKQIIGNILSNAVKYSPRDEQIILELTNDHDIVKIKVIDKGVGISEVDKNFLYEPFFRSEENIGKIQGTGLGLSIAKKSADLLGIELKIDSEIGIGTTVTIIFKC